MIPNIRNESLDIVAMSEDCRRISLSTEGDIPRKATMSWEKIARALHQEYEFDTRTAQSFCSPKPSDLLGYIAYNACAII